MKFKLTVLLSIFFSTTIFANTSTNKFTTDSLHKDSIAADFPGGIGLFYNYLKTTVKYPIASRLRGVQGKVQLKFVIDTTGKVTRVKVMKGLDKFTNMEAVRVIRQSPNWISGSVKGKKVNYTYNIPISFSDTSSYKDAAVMISGKLLKNANLVAKLSLDTMPYYIIPENLTQAVLGQNYKRKLLVFNKTILDLKSYDEAHFQNAFKLLQNIDTSKVQLNVYSKDMQLDEWRKYLNKDSIISIFIYPPSVSKPYDPKKLGTVVLMTRAGLSDLAKMKRDLIDTIMAYRKGSRNPPKQMIAIDDWYNSPELVFNGIDTAIIKSVNIIDSARVARIHGPGYKSGIIYIYTKNYNPNKFANDRQMLLAMIDQYNKTQIDPIDDQLYINHVPYKFKAITDVPTKDITFVRRVTKEETKAIMGFVPMRNSIYVQTTQEYINRSPVEVKISPPPNN
ncbi:MAG: energy transducer TonB [Bacteroidota bacterium]